MKISKECSNCGSPNITKKLKIDEIYTLYICQNCLLTFTFPQPKITKVTKANNSIYDSAEELKSRLANYQIEYNRALHQIKEIKKYKKSGKFLDIGCSYGIALQAAKDNGFSVIGVEPTKKAADYATKQLGFKVFHADLEHAKLPLKSFDIITLFDVLEHIPDLRKFLRKIYTLLKPGGLLVIQSPNVESFACKILKQNWNWLLVPNHLWHFSSQSIKKTLLDNGFRVKKINTKDNTYDFSSNLTSKIFSYKNESNISAKIARKLTYVSLYTFITLFSPIWSNLGKGGSLQVYAIKK